MIDLVGLVTGFGGQLQPQLGKDLDVYRGQHHRGMHLAADQFRELLLGNAGILFRQRADAQGNQHLVGVQAWVVAA